MFFDEMSRRFHARSKTTLRKQWRFGVDKHSPISENLYPRNQLTEIYQLRVEPQKLLKKSTP